MDIEKENKIIRSCPNCGKDVDFSENPFRPFCSKRCKMADLGSWLRQEYYITSSFYHHLETERKTDEG